MKMSICGPDYFQMSQMQANGLKDLVFFIICIYGRYWFAAPMPAEAPFLTLSLWRDIERWASHDASLSSSLLRTLSRHTWYLTGRLITVSLFSRMVDEATKREIVVALLLLENEECEIPLGKPELPPIHPESTLASFVTPESWFLFQVKILT